MIRTIDFNGLATGTTVTDQYLSEGVRISAKAYGAGVDEAMIFDSSNPTGDDLDLGTAHLGNLLIISEDGDESDPDDNYSGGFFEFDFDTAATVKSLTFVDIEEGATVYFYAADGTLISQQTIHATANNGISVVDFNVADVDRMVVVLNGSGAVDNLVFDDNLPEPDGIVSGDETANDIDLAYLGDPEGDRIDAADAVIAGEAPDDDIVDARGGNDRVSALEGNDEIYGGAGNDTVSGGTGDDLIFGDSMAENGTRESFNWSELGAADGTGVSSFTQDTGTTNVTFTNLSSSYGTSTTYSTDALYTGDIDGGDETVDNDSSLESKTLDWGRTAYYKLSFDSPVHNVDFNINDIDGYGRVTVEAYDVHGNPLPVTLTGGARLTLSDTNATSGNDTAISDGNYAYASSAEYALNVDIAGPVSKVVIKHVQDGPDRSVINITDVFFDAGVVDVTGGNDSLMGDSGADTIFGEGGDDTLIGGAGADSLSGGDGADRIIGGSAGDVVDGGTGGTDYDILDLSDSGPLRVADGSVSVDADGNSTSGTIEFLNEDGSVSGSMTFAEIEELILPAVNQAPVAADDFAVTTQGAAVTIPVLENDSDPDGDALSIIQASSAEGAVAINADGTLTFTPDADFFGDAVINYTVADETGDMDTAVVRVTVRDGIVTGTDAGDLIDAGYTGDPEGDRVDNNDAFRAGEGPDDDIIVAGDGNDTVLAGAGDDELFGGIGDDSLTGGTGADLFDGGAGADTLIGGADRDTFVNVGAGDVIDGSETGDDFDYLDLTGSAPEGGSLNILPDPTDPTNPENGIVQYRNADGSDAGQLVFSNIEQVVPCFTPGTLIATPRGERRVETLEVGDRVITRDNGMQQIRWIGKRDMSGDELAAKAHLRPVLIRKGALGNGLPERDLMVSPQHRLLVANDKTALYFEEREVLVAAKHLTDMAGIDVVEVSSTSYIHIMFDRHEVVLSDGTWTESFQPGDLSLAGVRDTSREEILELFPELATRAGVDAYTSARKALKRHEARLITR